MFNMTAKQLEEHNTASGIRKQVVEALEEMNVKIPRKSVRWATVLEEILEYEKPYKRGSNGELSARIGKPRRVLGKPIRIPKHDTYTSKILENMQQHILASVREKVKNSNKL